MTYIALSKLAPSRSLLLRYCSIAVAALGVFAIQICQSFGNEPVPSAEWALDEVLRLGGSIQLDPRAAERRSLLQLQVSRIRLANTRTSDDSLTFVRGLNDPPLLRLDLSGTNISDRGITSLALLTRLYELDISHTKVTNEGIARLVSFKQLHRLHLTGCGVDDRGFESLTPLKTLIELSLSKTKVTGASFVTMAKFPKLRELRLSHLPIADAHVSELTRCVDLEVVDLSHTLLTETSVESLVKLNKMRLLDVRKTRIGQAGIENLRQSLPNCRILCDFE